MGLLRNLFGSYFKQPDYSFHFDTINDSWLSVEGMTAEELYKSQANLRAVISFIADSIAQLPLNVYRRVDETTRLRDRECIAAKLLYKPNSNQTSYDFWSALTIEYLLYGEAIVLVLPDFSPSGYQLRVIPSMWVDRRSYENRFAPKKLRIHSEGTANYVDVDETQFIIFKMYRPGHPAGSQSPIASLKATLSEQINAARFRNQLWENSGRMNAYLTRSANVTPWTKESRDAFIESFRNGWSSKGDRAGSIPILEDGMELKSVQFSAKEAQYAESIQLTREDVAAAYHINPSLIWHTNTQTYASAKDNARALYSDCLGPLIQMFQQRLNSFLLPMLNEDEFIYVEFNLEEKLKGSFEERASIYQSAAGSPWLTRNEVRAEYNLPPIEGADKLIIPLNVITGGQASPQDSSANSYANRYASTQASTKDGSVNQKADEQLQSIEVDLKPSEDNVDAFEQVLEKFMKRQERVIATKLKAVTEWWDAERWNEELKQDLIPILRQVSEAKGREIAKRLASIYYTENTEAYLEKLAETQAEYINQNTYEALLEAQLTDDSVSDVFKRRLLMIATIAYGLSTIVERFAMNEAVDQAVFQGVVSKPRVTKTWHTGHNPRDSHAAIDGETVGIDESFSNGLQWPHSYGPVEEVAGCNCWVSVQLEW